MTARGRRKRYCTAALCSSTNLNTNARALHVSALPCSRPCPSHLAVQRQHRRLKQRRQQGPEVQPHAPQAGSAVHGMVQHRGQAAALRHARQVQPHGLRSSSGRHGSCLGAGPGNSNAGNCSGTPGIAGRSETCAWAAQTATRIVHSHLQVCRRAPLRPGVQNASIAALALRARGAGRCLSLWQWPLW